MISSHLRGHLIEYYEDQWYYFDTRDLADCERPCIRCGEMPTIEGYDACLGHILGARSVCCGHGVEVGYAYS